MLDFKRLQFVHVIWQTQMIGLKHQAKNGLQNAWMLLFPSVDEYDIQGRSWGQINV